MIDLTKPIYRNKEAARKYLEKIRWPNGVICPFCGGMDKIATVRMMSKPSKKNPAPKEQKGWFHCGDCRDKFTVRIGTVCERSHISLDKWVLATHLLCASKKGMSAHQLHRMLGVSYESAWFLGHRIREAMKISGGDPFGGGGRILEMDETYHGHSEEKPTARTDGTPFLKRKPSRSRAIVSLVERGGRVKSLHVANATKATINKILAENVARDTRLHTDESALYNDALQVVSKHEKIRHASGEFVRGDVHTNSAEGYFSLFKRGMAIYQKCGDRHLQRYLCEFDFRYNLRRIDDNERTEIALAGMAGKRLMYNQK